MHLTRKLTTFGIAAAVALAATPAIAADEGRIAGDWARTLGDASTWVLANAERTESSAQQQQQPGAESARVAYPELGTAWFGVAPKVTLVARDWGQSISLSGRLTPTEAMRLSRSSRMVVSRIRISGGRIVPFTQLGLGEWRIDADVLPLLPRITELAGQVGAGVELHLSGSWELALESNMTVIYRELHEQQNLPATRLFGAMVASRVEF